MLQFNDKLRNYRTALLFVTIVLLIGLVILLIYGKTGTFLAINNNHTPFLDIFFTYATFVGDGFIYVPILLYAIIFNRKFFIPVAAGVLFCTVLAQGVKRIVDEPRPVSLEEKNIVIRKIEGQNTNRQHSFPSGHTSTAFTMALMFVTIIRQKVWAFILPLVAMIVAYSRVYLAQHFLPDVLGGMTVGIIASYCALWVYQAYLKKRGREQELETKKI